MTMVKEVMRRSTVTVGPEVGVQKLCRQLVRHGMSGVPVVDGGERLLGFVSERDIIAAVPRRGFLDLTARRLMKRRVETVAPDDPVTKASRIFSEKGYRQLPVVKGRRVVGILSRQDIIKHLLGHYY